MFRIHTCRNEIFTCIFALDLDTFLISGFTSAPSSRLNLADIDRISPLAEGALPYHLAEAQKQVCMWVWEGVYKWVLGGVGVYKRVWMGGCG